MDGHNEVTLVGTLGADPELKTVSKQDGTTINKVAFNMVTTRNFKQGDEWKKDSTWHQVEVWGAQADYLHKYAKKGYDISIFGELRKDHWEDKESGQKRERVYVLTRRAVLHDNRAKGGATNAAPANGAVAEANAPASNQQNAAKNVQQYATSQAQPVETFNSQDFSGADDDLPF